MFLVNTNLLHSSVQCDLRFETRNEDEDKKTPTTENNEEAIVKWNTISNGYDFES